MEDYVLNFLKAEWKVSDTDSTHWASDLNSYEYQEIAHIYLQDKMLLTKFHIIWLSGFRGKAVLEIDQ
jgi:hypothetical protein